MQIRTLSLGLIAIGMMVGHDTEGTTRDSIHIPLQALHAPCCLGHSLGAILAESDISEQASAAEIAFPSMRGIGKA